MATRVSITKALEARLRGSREFENVLKVVDELIKLLDDEQGKRAAALGNSEAKTGLGYRELVALFRSFLGDSLITPPKPNTTYVVRILNKAREQGIDSTNVEQAIAGLRRSSRGPYRLGDIVYNYDTFYASGKDGNKETEEGGVLYTGRGGSDFE